MDADVVLVPADERGRLTERRVAIRRSTSSTAADRERVFAIVATVGHDQRRCRRRSRGSGGGGRRTRHVDARRRCLRRRRARRSVGPPPVRGHRARRQFHRRPAQVAVRAVRLVRAAVPRPGDRQRRRTPSTPSTSTCCMRSVPRTSRGTPATTPTTSRVGPAACRSGSAWRPTAPTPTPRRSRRPCSVTREGGRASIAAAPHTELVHGARAVDPDCFRRTGWSAAQYQAWSDAELATGRSFVVPTTWNGEVLLRLCIVNPMTSLDDIALDPRFARRRRRRIRARTDAAKEQLRLRPTPHRSTFAGRPAPPIW